MVKEVRQPCLDIDSGKFAAAHNRVHHGRILCRIVVLPEEVILARQCDWTLPVLDKIGVYSVPAVDDIAARVVIVGDCIVDNTQIAEIGDNVELAVGCKVIGRIKIGNNVIVAPNAVVVKDVPNNAIVGGVPATIIKISGKSA